MTNKIEVFQFLFGTLDNALHTFVTTSVTNLGLALVIPVHSAVTLYIVIYGYQVITGKIQEPILDFALKAIKIAFIITIALESLIYNKIIVDFFESMQTEIVKVIAYSFQGVTASVDSASIYSLLDGGISKGMELAGTVWDKAGVSAPGYFITYLIIVIALIAIFTSAALIITFAKVGLAILLGIGPLFVCLLLFPQTSSFFFQWLGQALNYTFIMIIGSIVTCISIVVMNVQIQAAITHDNILFDSICILALGLLFASIMKQVPNIAAAIVGGIRMDFGGLRPVIAPTTKYAFGAARAGGAAGRTVHQTMKQQTSFVDKKTGETSSASRYRHLLNGRVKAVFGKQIPAPGESSYKPNPPQNTRRASHEAAQIRAA